MEITNLQVAEDFLLHVGYHRLRNYLPRLSNNQFVEYSTIDLLISRYNKDSWMRNRLVGILETVEISSKAFIAYYLGCEYGPECFYSMTLCHNSTIVEKIEDTIYKEARNRRDDEDIKYHNGMDGGRYPIWMIIDFLPFNTISQFYFNLSQKDKKLIASKYYDVDEIFLQSWLHTLSVLRNICAHCGYLYLRSHTVKPKLFKEWNLNPKKSTLYTIFHILREISKPAIFSELLTELRTESKGSNWLMAYGFPEDWTDRFR